MNLDWLHISVGMLVIPTIHMREFLLHLLLSSLGQNLRMTIRLTEVINFICEAVLADMQLFSLVLLL